VRSYRKEGDKIFILSNFLVATAHVLNLALTIFYWLVLIRAIMSWVNPDPFNPIVQFLEKSTEPVLEPIRRILPAGLKLGIDISPIIAFLAIIFLKSFLVNSLLDLAMRLQ
jgi:YggT family protein